MPCLKIKKIKVLKHKHDKYMQWKLRKRIPCKSFKTYVMHDVFPAEITLNSSKTGVNLVGYTNQPF
jgi:hypothetical protein